MKHNFAQNGKTCFVTNDRDLQYLVRMTQNQKEK